VKLVRSREKEAFTGAAPPPPPPSPDERVASRPRPRRARCSWTRSEKVGSTSSRKLFRHDPGARVRAAWGSSERTIAQGTVRLVHRGTQRDLSAGCARSEPPRRDLFYRLKVFPIVCLRSGAVETDIFCSPSLRPGVILGRWAKRDLRSSERGGRWSVLARLPLARQIFRELRTTWSDGSIILANWARTLGGTDRQGRATLLLGAEGADGGRVGRFQLIYRNRRLRILAEVNFAPHIARF